jgi:hypothetical protein
MLVLISAKKTVPSIRLKTKPVPSPLSSGIKFIESRWNVPLQRYKNKAANRKISRTAEVHDVALI